MERSDLRDLQNLLVETVGEDESKQIIEKVPGDMSSFFLWCDKNFALKFNKRVKKTELDKKRDASKSLGSTRAISDFKKEETYVIS